MPTGESLGRTLIERLLAQGEGVALDFKRDQYQFPSGPDHKKAELLKDVIAFANSYRSEDAFILIGVAEDEFGRGQLVGSSTHFDDADLQQFANASRVLNRHVEVTYGVVDIDGKRIGVIRIPRQQRPVYATRDLGIDPSQPNRQNPVVKANAVYYRRGSSTFVATPDDVYTMGRLDAAEARPAPAFDLQFADPITGHNLGRDLRREFKVWSCSTKISALMNCSGPRECRSRFKAGSMPLRAIGPA